MIPFSRRADAAVILVLLAETAIFGGSFAKYFNLDSLYYIVTAPDAASRPIELFSEPQAIQQYRPMTLAFVAPFVKWWGANPAPYHWIPLTFHLANTWLLYRLGRRLAASPWTAVLAAVLWGLHPVAGLITYDLTYLSDFLSAFLLLAALILAVDGAESRSRVRTGAAVFLFVGALLSKEAAVAFPVAVLVCLIAAEPARSRGGTARSKLPAALRRAAPQTAIWLAASAVLAGAMILWLQSGRLYSQAAASDYRIDPLSNALGKFTYLWWAAGLPVRGEAGGKELTVTLLAAVPIVVALASFVLRRFRLERLEVGGILWFALTCLPALMLSNRLAKWYLYVPLIGAALALGCAAERLVAMLPGQARRFGLPALALAVCGPAMYSSAVQAKSHLRHSNDAFVSDTLGSFVAEMRRLYPTLPSETTLLMLPAFEHRVADYAKILSSPPIDNGELFALLYPGSIVRVFFPHRGDRLPKLERDDPGLRVAHYLDGEFHDVTAQFRVTGTVSMFVLPTPEKKTPPLFDTPPGGGWDVYGTFVRISYADRGASLPEDLRARDDLWIVQYIHGHFYDVTGFYKGRRLSPATRLISDVERLRAEVSRSEFYPDYQKFGTPNSRPVFAPMPTREIVTQIGGSSVYIPIEAVPRSARLRFDVAWMNDSGDGGWAEIQWHSAAGERVLFREYMKPNPPGKGFRWKEIAVDLRSYAGESGELVLRCYNDPGNNTVSDWLNWRDIVFETTPGTRNQSRDH